MRMGILVETHQILIRKVLPTLVWTLESAVTFILKKYKKYVTKWG